MISPVCLSVRHTGGQLKTVDIRIIKFSLYISPIKINDLELIYVRIFADLGGNNCCQQQHCNPLNVFFNIMFLALICHRFLR